LTFFNIGDKKYYVNKEFAW